MGGDVLWECTGLISYTCMPPAAGGATTSQGTQLKCDTLCTQCTTHTTLDAHVGLLGSLITSHCIPAQCGTFSLASPSLLQPTKNPGVKDFPKQSLGLTCYLWVVPSLSLYS